MASSDSLLTRLGSALGPTGPTRRLGGGAWRVTVGERELVAKVGSGVLDEADGLRSLARVAGAPPVPEVVLDEPDLLVTAWVYQGVRAAAHEEALGRMLATLHTAPWLEWGGGSSWIGACSVNPSVVTDAVAFYEGRLLQLARRCGLERPVAAVAARLDRLLPSGGPALLHGDLWWGNVLWGSDGRPWLIDPSVHGGHPEEDMAMLALFGAVPERVLRAYFEIRPLQPGWEERVALFQLYPLLVHAVLFGGGYRTEAEATARRFA
ncbi:MAG: fructosamine kinase family protein [Actinomycetota bacterium]|nr:fructosamine kinase family protein [Actinomycetota bacterium]